MSTWAALFLGMERFQMADKDSNKDLDMNELQNAGYDWDKAKDFDAAKEAADRRADGDHGRQRGHGDPNGRRQRRGNSLAGT